MQINHTPFDLHEHLYRAAVDHALLGNDKSSAGNRVRTCNPAEPCWSSEKAKACSRGTAKHTMLRELICICFD